MKKLLFVGAFVALSLCAALAQELRQPWKDWEPPVMDMPHPNALDLYQQAFDLIEELGDVDLGGDYQELRDALKAHSLTFRLLEEAMMGECRLPPVLAPDQAFPYLAKFRSSARLLRTRANIYWEDGRLAEAALDCTDCVRLASDAARGGPAIAGLVCVACETIGLRSLQDMIPSMQAEDCRTALAALQAAQAERVTLAEIMESEALFSRIFMKWQFTEMGKGIINNILEQNLDEEQVQEALKTWQPADTWEAAGKFAETLIEQARKPYWDQAEVQKPGDPLLDILVPVYSGVNYRFALSDARLRLALVHLAAQAYMLDTGPPPEDLEALVPEYLPTVPDDPFTDGPLSSAFIDGDFVFYSVGPDGLDNGGIAAAEPVEADSEGDIVVVL